MDGDGGSDNYTPLSPTPKNGGSGWLAFGIFAIIVVGGLIVLANLYQ